MERTRFTAESTYLDGNEHMNNAAYLIPFDAAARGLIERDLIGAVPFVRRAKYTYLAPVKLGENVELGSEIERWDIEGIRVHQKMFGPNGKVVARADLDYGVVRRGAGTMQNHQGVARMLEDERRAYLDRVGLGIESLRERKLGIYIWEIGYVYSTPFFAGLAGIESEWNVLGPKILVDQKMNGSDGELVRTNAVCVFVNTETGKSVRPPEDLAVRFYLKI